MKFLDIEKQYLLQKDGRSTQDVTARFLYIQHCCGVTQVRNTRLSLVSSTNAASTCMYQFSHERSVANSHIKASFDLRTLAKKMFSLTCISFITLRIWQGTNGGLGNLIIIFIFQSFVLHCNGFHWIPTIHFWYLLAHSGWI